MKIENESIPDFTDPIFIAKMSEASELLLKVAHQYAYNNYSTPSNNSYAEIARFSFIRGFNFANHSLEQQLSALQQENEKLRAVAAAAESLCVVINKQSMATWTTPEYIALENVLPICTSNQR